MAAGAPLLPSVGHSAPLDHTGGQAIPLVVLPFQPVAPPG